MPFTTISSGITFSIPTTGTQNWGSTMATSFTTISSHDHTGSGSGVQLGTSALVADAVTGAKLRLDNDEFIRARNNANSANVNLIKLDTTDNLELHCDASKQIQMVLNGTHRWSFDAGGNLISNTGSTSLAIVSNTSDASDNGQLIIGGGGGGDETRGSFISFHGNEHASTGLLDCVGGNVSGGGVRLKTVGSQSITFTTGNTARFEIEGAAGHLDFLAGYPTGTPAAGITDYLEVKLAGVTKYIALYA